MECSYSYSNCPIEIWERICFSVSDLPLMRTVDKRSSQLSIVNYLNFCFESYPTAKSSPQVTQLISVIQEMSCTNPRLYQLSTIIHPLSLTFLKSFPIPSRLYNLNLTQQLLSNLFINGNLQFLRKYFNKTAIEAPSKAFAFHAKKLLQSDIGLYDLIEEVSNQDHKLYPSLFPQHFLDAHYLMAKATYKVEFLKLFQNFEIQVASAMGDADTVKQLMESKKVDPSAYKNYAVRVAGGKGHLGVLKVLLTDSNVDPSALDNHALLISIQDGFLEVVKYLIEHPRVSLNKEFALTLISVAAPNCRKFIENHARILSLFT